MAMNTYRQAQKELNPQSNKMVNATTGETKYDNLSAGFQKQAAAYKEQEGLAVAKGIQSLSVIPDTVAKIANVEAEENAVKRGKERAQLDFAEIQKLKKTSDEAGAAIAGTAEGTPERALLVEQQGKINGRLKELLTKHSQFNISERVRSDELNEIYVNQVGIDTKNTIGQLYNKFKSSPDVFEAEANKLLSQADSVPLQFRETVKANIRNDIATHKSRATDHVEKVHLEQLHASRVQKLTSLNNEVTQLAREGKNTIPHLDEIKSILTKQLNEETITQEQYNTYFTHISKDIVKQKAFGTSDKIVESKMTDGQKLTAMLKNAEEFNDTLQPLLSADEKTVLYNDLKRRAKLYQTKINTQITAQKKIDTKQYNKLLKRAQSGKDIGSNDMAEFKTLALRLSKGDEYNAAVVLYDNVQRFQASTPQAQTHYIELYKQEIADDEAAGKSTIDKRLVLETLQKQGEKNAKAIESDVIGYSIKNPVKFGGITYQAKDLNQGQNLIGFREDGSMDYTNYNEFVTGEFSERFNNKDNFMQHMGKFEIMSDSEATKFRTNYENMSINDKQNLLKTLNSQIGMVQTNKIFSKVWKDKPGTSAIAGMFYNKGSKGTNIADDMLFGQSLRLNGGVKLDTKSMKLLKDKVYSKLASSMHLLDEKETSMYTQSIVDYYIGNNIQDGELQSNDEAGIQDAFDAVTGGTTTYNGKPLVSPEVGKNGGDIKDWLEYNAKNNMVLENQFGETPPDGYVSWNSFKEELKYTEGKVYGKGTFDVRTAGPNGRYVLMKGDNMVKIGGKPLVLDWFKDDPLDDKAERKPWYKGQ